jgi:hypothetical protein
MSSLTGTNLQTEYHCYFDGPPGRWGGPGYYSGNYASYDENPEGGIINLTPYVTYCNKYGVSGYLGEFAWPNDSTAGYGGGSVGQWMTLGNNLLAYLAANKVRGMWWNYTSLTRFIGSPSTVNPQRGVDDPRLLAMLGN